METEIKSYKGKGRGRKREKDWSLKEIKPGKFYLYTWDFDYGKTQEVRASIRLDMEKNPLTTEYTSVDLARASQYKWYSHGAWNLTKPSKRLTEYIAKNPSKVFLIEQEYRLRLAKTNEKNSPKE